MGTSPWKLVLYTTAAGRCPVREYLTDLDREERLRVADCLGLLEAFGLGLGAPHVRSLGNKLWELRITGQVQHRVLYFATLKSKASSTSLVRLIGTPVYKLLTIRNWNTTVKLHQLFES